MNKLFDFYTSVFAEIGYRRIDPWEILPWKEVHFSRPLIRKNATRKKFHR